MSRQAVAEAKAGQARSLLSERPGLLDSEVAERDNSVLDKNQEQRTARHNFGLVQVRNMVTPVIQPKLKIGKPGDKYEQEADKVADQVMRMPDNEVGKKTPSVTPVQTQSVQRDAFSKQAPVVTSGIQAKVERLHISGGEPLTQDVRNFMEPRLGQDLSAVRIHRNFTANEIAGELHARAFTTGNHIVFGRGQFQSGNDVKKPLLTHELVHTIQQDPNNPTVIQRDLIGGSEAFIPETTNNRGEQLLEGLLSLSTEEAVARVSELRNTVLVYQVRNALVKYKSASNESTTKLRAIYDALTRQINGVVSDKEETAQRSQESEKASLRRARKAKRRAERKTRTRRLTGKAAPTSTREAISQLNFAKAGATVDPTNFEASTKILRQVSDWLYTLQTPQNIDKHFELRGFNKTAASSIANHAYSKVKSLYEHVKRISSGGRERPMSDGLWSPVLKALQNPYLRTLAGEKSKGDEEFFETTEKAGYIKGAGILALPAVPLIIQGGVAVGSAAASGATAILTEAAATTRLLLAANSSRAALTLLGGQIVMKPDLYYAAFGGLVGSALAVAEVGGPIKFVEKASTLEGAIDLGAKMTVSLVTHGGGGIRKSKSGASTPNVRRPADSKPRAPISEAPRPPKKKMFDPIKETKGSDSTGSQSATKGLDPTSLGKDIVHRPAAGGKGSLPSTAPPKPKSPVSPTSTTSISETVTVALGIRRRPKDKVPEARAKRKETEKKLNTTQRANGDDRGSRIDKRLSSKEQQSSVTKKEIEEIFAEADRGSTTGVPQRGARKQDVLEERGIESRPKPGGKAVPEKFEMGNFAHEHAEELISADRLPRGLAAEVTIELSAGKIRLDRVDWKNRVIYEIKPNTRSQIIAGEKQAKNYEGHMNEQYPGPKKWKSKVVTYDKDVLLRVLKAIGFLK